MKKNTILLTLLVLLGLLITSLDIDRHQPALAQSEPPPVPAPLVLPENLQEGTISAPDWSNNLPNSAEISDGSIQSAISRQMSYQGRLMVNGSPCQGSINVTFRLWDLASGGTKRWEETQSVTCDKGLFSVMLGKVTPLPYAQQFQSQLWLGIQPAGATSELTPRQLLGTVPYAMNLHGGATIVDANPPGDYSYSFWVSSVNHPAIYASSYYTDTMGIKGEAYGKYSGGGNMPVGVDGYAQNGIGVQGWGSTAGVSGKSDYIGVVAQGTLGVEALVNGPYSTGVYAYTGSYTGTIAMQAVAYGVNSYGTYSYASGDYSKGILGYSAGKDSSAIHAITYGDDQGCPYGDSYCASGVIATVYGDAYGMYSFTNQRSPYIGVNADSGYYTAWLNNLTGSTGNGFYSKGFTYLEGNLTVTGSKSGYVVDIALNASSEPLERGDVVAVVGVDAPVLGEIPVMRVVKANSGNAASIVGVVDQLWEPCQKPAEELQAGEACGGYDYEATLFQPGQYISVVTLGAYGYLKVDASYGPIHAGDLLSISPTAGVAAQAQQITVSEVSFYAPGTILGKALQDFDSGSGYIAVFVTLK